MGDGVKFIFKTLFKVPVIIFVSFFIMNILFFFLVYFKMLGFSYVIMQTAVENNYLPTQELRTLTAYARSLDMYDDAGNPMAQQNTCVITWYNTDYPNDSAYDTKCRDVGIYLQGDANQASVYGDTNGDASRKKQYGRVSKVGCSTEYTIIWPLDYSSTIVEGKVAGNGTGSMTLKSGSELEAMRNDAQHKVKIPIRIVYTVPGLKYYPDLLNY